MRKISICTFLFLLTYVGFSQDSNMLQGKVITSDSTKVTINIINLNKKLGTINDKHGHFIINAAQGDSVIFSSIRYRQKTHIITAEDLKKATLKIVLELEVNELDEVKISNGSLSGDIEQDAKKIKTYKDYSPLFNAQDLDLTPFIKEKGAATVKNIATINEMDATPINIIAVGRMIYSVFKKKGKPKKKQLIKPRVSTYYSNLFLTKELAIPESEIYNFLDFIDENLKTKDVLESRNDLKILEFLIQQRDAYFLQYTNKN